MELYSKLSQIHFAADRKNKSQAFRFYIDFTQELNDKALLSALEQTLEFFPVFACRPYISADKKTVGMKPNPLPPVICHDDSPVALGTDGTNGYLFRLANLGKTLMLSVFHALADAHTAHMFLIHLLYYYFTAMGHKIDPEGALMTDKDLADRDVTAPLEDKLAEYGITERFSDPAAPPAEQIFHDLREEELFDSDVYAVKRCALPFAELRKLTHELHTTPLLLMCVLGAQALRETADVGDKYVYSSYAADLRSRLHSRSTGEFGSVCGFYSSAEEAKLPLSGQLERAKSEFDRIMSGDLILRVAKGMVDYADMMTAYMDYTKKDAMIPMLAQMAKKTSSTVFYTNVGPLRFPKDIEAFMNRILIEGPPAKLDPTVSMHTFKDTLYIAFLHNTNDGAHFIRIVEKLVSLGVPCKILPAYTASPDYLGNIPIVSE